MRRFAKSAALLLLAGGLVLTGAANGFADKPGAKPADKRSDKRADKLGHESRHREPARIQLVGINNKGRERRGQHFSPARLNTLVVVVDWQTLVGAHVQRLELITPAGSLYQRFKSDVQSADGRASVETPVPMAGTWITEFQIFGEWTVNVYLDGGTTPVATTHFTLAH
jgi:hypothetical protein